MSLQFRMQLVIDEIDKLAGRRGEAPVVVDVSSDVRALSQRLDDLTAVVTLLQQQLDDRDALLGNLSIGGSLSVGGNATIGGSLNHDGSTAGFYGTTPAAQASASANLTDSSGGTANDTVQALTDPADSPATADALRDDLVANLIPELRNNFADLAAKVNKALTVLRDIGLMAT